MIRSMTGFGRTERHLPNKKLTIEVRSLNGKQLDINTRIPAPYREKELAIRQMIGTALERGKVECILQYELTGDACSGNINEPVVKNYYQQLYRISGELGLESSLELLSAVMRLPDTITSEKTELEEAEWKVIEKGLLEALVQLNDFRIQEGKAMEKDLKDRVSAILQNLEQVEEYEGERIEQIRDRIGNNLIAYLPEKEQVDENRFEQELIFYLEKLDISEEKVRLANHCAYFLETMMEEPPSGKKLGFISQEMGREINTIGSKANNSDIQRLVVLMKDELERIKEQILNVL